MQTPHLLLQMQEPDVAAACKELAPPGTRGVLPALGGSALATPPTPVNPTLFWAQQHVRELMQL